MAIFKTSYNTTACSGFRTKETIDKLKIASMSNSLKIVNITLDNFETPVILNIVEGGNSHSDVVPYFNHPIFMVNNDSGVMVDVRCFGKWNSQQGEFTVRNRPEHEWNIMRSVLNCVWVNERTEILRDVSIIPASVYAALISECVARKYALDAAEQINISIVSCYYYYCLFTDEKHFNDSDKNRLAGAIARATKIPADKVFKVIDDLVVLNSLDELCEAIKTKTDSVRLDDFNVGVLIAIASGNWFGNNARENLATGLEHIPTWLMICYAALNEATFKRSVLAKLVDRFAKGGAGSNFVKSIDTILNKVNLDKIMYGQ